MNGTGRIEEFVVWVVSRGDIISGTQLGEVGFLERGPGHAGTGEEAGKSLD
jgi:hypothetical protein